MVISYTPNNGGLDAEVIANMETGAKLMWNGEKAVYEVIGNIYEKSELLEANQ